MQEKRASAPQLILACLRRRAVPRQGNAPTRIISDRRFCTAHHMRSSQSFHQQNRIGIYPFFPRVKSYSFSIALYIERKFAVKVEISIGDIKKNAFHHNISARKHLEPLYCL